MKKSHLSLIYLFTGNGKGKTSAALGVATRAVCAGFKVAWISWYKEAQWGISEQKLPEFLPIDFYLLGKGFYIKKNPKPKNTPPFVKGASLRRNVGEFGGFNHGTMKKSNNDSKKSQLKTAPLKGGGVVVDDDTPKDHKHAAKAALAKAIQILTAQKHDLLVCDEMINTLKDKLLTASQVKTILQSRGKTHLVLTGRKAPKSLINLADLATNMTKLKHPYDQGIKAVKGLDF